MIIELLFLVVVGSLVAWLGLRVCGDAPDKRVRERLDRYITRH